MYHDQMIHTQQSVQRRPDLMAHVGEKYFLCPGFLHNPDCSFLVYHDDQQHTYHRHHTDHQHGNTHGRKSSGLLHKDFLIQRHDEIQIHSLKGNKIKQLPVIFLFMEMVESKRLPSFQLPGQFLVGQFRIR